jgi:hypothetical protein
MTEAHPGSRGATAALGLAELLCLAATPTFAILALLTGLGGSPMDRLCSSGHGGAAGRNGHHVPPQERVSFAALAEAGLQPAKRCRRS